VKAARSTSAPGRVAAVLLGISRGGIAEMAITASVLGLGVPVETAFHVVRYPVVLALTALIWRCELLRRQSAP
jgi:hypothetical protein